MNQAAWTWAFDPAELGAAIRTARVQRGLLQEDLAELLDVSRMTVSRLERGGSVSIGTAIAALTECGMALVVVPKFARVVVEGGVDPRG